MALPPAKIQCVTCRKFVPKGEAHRVTSQNKIDYRYECDACFSKGELAAKAPGKTESYFCGRCRYKFTSRVAVCPYCSQRDQVDIASVKLKDLL